MKIHVLGSIGMGRQMAAALAISLAAKQTEVVLIDSLNDLNPNDGDVLICDDDIETNSKVMLFAGHPLANIGLNPFPEAVKPHDYKDTSFRGGSVGKGGKIKYRRN